MDNSKRKKIEGLIDKASKHLQIAKQHLDSSVRYSEAVEDSQECIELSVKSVLSLLDINYSPIHGWEQNSKKFAAIAKQIQDQQLLERLSSQNLDFIIRLPRLLFLMNFWAQLYLTAKYGFEAENLASARDLFQREDAELAVSHAGECFRAASQLFNLDEGGFDAIVSA
jgi:HEPN domain-containing protein